MVTFETKNTSNKKKNFRGKVLKTLSLIASMQTSRAS